MGNMVLFGGAAVIEAAVVGSAAVVAACAVISVCPCCWPCTIPIGAAALALGVGAALVGLIGACVGNANGGKEPPPCPGRTDQCGTVPDEGGGNTAAGGAYGSTAGMALVNASAGMGGNSSSASTGGMSGSGNNQYGGLVASPI